MMHTMMLALVRRHGRVVVLTALLCALALGMAGFGGSAQAPLPPASPLNVGQVTNLRASATGQAPGTVKLTWNAAANAQVYFVVYLKSSEAMAGNYDSVRMKAFTGTEGVIGGLPSGAPYHFIATGMRWNWPAYGATWGSWSAWSSARPSAGSVATDRAALVAFYHATDGPNWTNKTNWLSAMSLNQWHGVTTDGSGRVTSLDINRNQLRGEIPAQLGHLVELQRLELIGNQLSGGLPAELGSLSNLASLDLAHNQLNGEIPADLGNLSRLVLLNLLNNQMSGNIPTELGNLTNLDAIELGGNQLTWCVPTTLQNVPRNDFVRLGLPFCE